MLSHFLPCHVWSGDASQPTGRAMGTSNQAVACKQYEKPSVMHAEHRILLQGASASIVASHYLRHPHWLEYLQASSAKACILLNWLHAAAAQREAMSCLTTR
jgi:hypothetical protein